ncbi:MAG: enoyl-CoA hydratase-related protein [Rhodocyclaceae bacterium]|jgi:2-(1,2-epoxy-1,2-dihydrophenyl)acetyl-CoA isomerase|nr:enoyl-CoA hydratase-related protein [Rhodocyclaceae bacterium]
MAETSIRLEIVDAVAHITLDRPASRNSIDLPMARALLAAVSAVARDNTARAVILRSSTAHFMVGGDVRRFGTLLDGPPSVCHAELDQLVATANAATLCLTRLACPVVGLVQGSVAGFGFSLAMACDLVVAADDTRFNLAYSAIGATPDGGASWHLPRLVGLQRALSIALLNTPVDAREALAMGLVSQVVSASELADAGQLLARRLAAGPAQAQANIKAMLRGTFDTDLESALATEKSSFLAMAETSDFVEGVRAFLGRRPPRFGNRRADPGY